LGAEGANGDDGIWIHISVKAFGIA